jgi:transcriptional regulator with XRE-family HTH domain
VTKRPEKLFAPAQRPFQNDKNTTKMGTQGIRSVQGHDDEEIVGDEGSLPSARGTDMDRHVGSRILERRLTLGLTLQQFAQLIGVSYQQAGKYERGLNRISAGRLHDIAQVLKVPMSWFFERMTPGGNSQDLSMRQPMLLELMRNFVAINNQRHQEALSEMARALAQSNNKDAGGER